MGKDVRAEIGYSERTEKRPFFYANAHEKDFVPLLPAEVLLRDARGIDADLDREGFCLVEHRSALTDLTDLAAVKQVHSPEIEALLKSLTGADHVAMTPVRYPALFGKIGRQPEPRQFAPSALRACRYG